MWDVKSYWWGGCGGGGCGGYLENIGWVSGCGG